MDVGVGMASLGGGRAATTDERSANEKDDHGGYAKGLRPAATLPEPSNSKLIPNGQVMPSRPPDEQNPVTPVACHRRD